MEKTHSECTVVVNDRAVACSVDFDGDRWRARAQLVLGDRPASALWAKLGPPRAADLEAVAGVALEAFAGSLEEAQQRAEALALRVGYMHLTERGSERAARRHGWA